MDGIKPDQILETISGIETFMKRQLSVLKKNNLNDGCDELNEEKDIQGLRDMLSAAELENDFKKIEFQRKSLDEYQVIGKEAMSFAASKLLMCSADQRFSDASDKLPAELNEWRILDMLEFFKDLLAQSNQRQQGILKLTLEWELL